MGRRFSKLEATIAMCAISTLATTVIKDQLKFAFGRTWPDTWGPGIVSFVRDNVYGFHFFQSGKSFESFPSGHAAVAAAVLSVVWMLFPSCAEFARSVWSLWILGSSLLISTLSATLWQAVSSGSRQDYLRSLCVARANWRCKALRWSISDTRANCGLSR